MGKASFYGGYGACLRGLFVEDHYKTLGVKSGASQKEIKAAYRDLATRLHPDQLTGSAEQMKA